MSAPVLPGEMSTQRLEQIASGAAPHPPMRLPLGPAQIAAVVVTDTCIGALDYGANALASMGVADLAKELRGMRDHLRAIGKHIIDTAAKPTDLHVAGMDEVPSAAAARAAFQESIRRLEP